MFFGPSHLRQDYGSVVPGRSRRWRPLAGISVRQRDSQRGGQFPRERIDKENIPLVQEIMGYSLVPSMPFHKLFWFYGTGRNGKSKIVTTLEYILGEDNCSNLNISEFKERRRFSLCQLYGKLLNISS